MTNVSQGQGNKPQSLFLDSPQSKAQLAAQTALATSQSPGGPGQVSASHTLLMIMIELLAAGVFTLLAGISNDVGNLVVIFCIGLWLIYMVTDSATISGLGRSLSKVANG